MFSRLIRALSLLFAIIPTLPALGLEPVYMKDPTPEVNPWEDKGIASNYTFGAYYTRRSPERNDEWHRFSRTDEYADVVVRFGSGEEQLVFSRETSYLPVWHDGSGKRPLEQMILRYGDGPKHRPDRICRHARVRIIESNATRAVIHWRYLPVMELPRPGRLPDQTTFVDEYFVIYPDRTVVRSMLEGTPRYEDWLAAAPGKVRRYRLRAEEGDGVQELRTTDADKVLMLEVMALPKETTPEPAPVRGVPDSLPKPIAEMTFDGGSGRAVIDQITGRACPIIGHSGLWRTGASGTALAFDGWTTKVNMGIDLSKQIEEQMTLDFWLAIAAYPWTECSLVEQIDRDPQGHATSGFRAIVNQEGQLIVSVKHGASNDWVRLTTEKIPRHEWTRITVAIDANKADSYALYVNGRKAQVARGGRPNLSKGQLVLGEGGRYNPGKPNGFKESYPFTFDGLLDELRIYNRALSSDQIAQGMRAFDTRPGEGIETEITRYGYPIDFAGTQQFGAHYTHMKFHPSWDRMFRMAGHPDIVVTFDKHPVRYVLWHGVGYIPMLINENGFWYSNEFNETWGAGGCYEPMSDKRMVYGRVHILEQSPARVVLKWRYPLSDVHYEIHGERAEWADANWGKWATWYMTIYPDGTMVKRMRVYSGKKPRLEWHESMGIMAPNQKPEDILGTRPALTLVTEDGNVRRYDWIDVPPTDVNYEDAVVHVVNMVGDYDPYTIQRIIGGDVYRSNNRGTGYSPFPSWNHWPVAQFPSDRFDTSHPHRAAHSSVTHIFWADSTPFGEKGLFVEKLLLEGMSNQPPEKLLPLAKSWLEPAKVEAGDGVTARFDPAQRAYVLTRNNGDVKSLTVKLAGSKNSPLVNPAFVVENWAGDQVGKVAVSGAQTDDIRQGVVRRANGVNSLIIWTELSSESSIELRISYR